MKQRGLNLALKMFFASLTQRQLNASCHLLAEELKRRKKSGYNDYQLDQDERKKLPSADVKV